VRSNVTLRSNIHIGRLAELGANGRLVSRVRGRPGLKKLLKRLEPGLAEKEAAGLHLLPEQIAELYQDACYECGFFIVGPTLSPEGPMLQVRCPRGQCKSSVLPTKELLIDGVMANLIRSETTSHPGVDLSAVITKALSLDGAPVGETLLQIVGRSGIRLSPTLHYRFYTWSDRAFSEIVKGRLIHLTTWMK
jgi:hypothetical protein